MNLLIDWNLVNNMLKLFLDTSNKYLYIAVLEDNQLLFEHVQPGNNNHSETLVQVLENILKENKIDLELIEEIYVGRGPGSYTGVRVACTVAKVLAYIKNKKLFSFSSLDLLLTTNFQNGCIVCEMDARRGFSYAKVFNVTNQIEVIKEEEFTETSKLQAEFKNALFITNESYNYNPALLLEKGLFKEEKDIHGFVPTYLRSGV